MASRQEEKERRRREREEAERAALAAASRGRRLQYAVAAVVAVAVVVVVVLVASGGGDKGGGGSADSSAPAAPAEATGGKLPPVRSRDLAAAAKAAGCVVQHPEIEGSTHVTTPVTYGTNPPTSGNHNPDPALDGVYESGPPEKEHFVHTLEHGRIEFQYKPGSPKDRVAQLVTLSQEKLKGLEGYKTLVFENPTGMPYQVAATSWGQLIGCNAWNDKVFDALRAFRLEYTDHAPEASIPPNNMG